RTFADLMFTRIKAIVPVGNKADLLSNDGMSVLQHLDTRIFPVSAEYELAVQRALAHGLITSRLPPFSPTDKANQKQVEVLKQIEAFISSGIVARPFDILGEIVERILKLIVVYPVYDESTWSDKAGNILPDAFLMQDGSTPLDLAYKIHTDIGEGFIRAVDCKSRMVIGKDHILRDGEVIRIISKS
ncbi:translation-associated GTPase, partial [mine drainage metagenome]